MPDIAPHANIFHKYSYTYSVVSVIFIALDVLSFYLSSSACYLYTVGFNVNLFKYYMVFTTVSCIFYVVLSRSSNMYDIQNIIQPLRESDKIIISVITSIFLFLLVIYSLKVSDIYSNRWIYGFLLSTIVTVILFRFAGSRLLAELSRRRIIGRNVVVFGAGEQGKELLSKLQISLPHFISVVGVFDDKHELSGGEVEGYPVLGNLDALIRHARKNRVDDIIVALPWSAEQRVVEVVDKLRELPVNVFLSSDLAGFRLEFRPAPGHFDDLPLFEVVDRPISGWSVVLKMFEDYILATLMIIMLIPVFAIVAIAIKMNSPGPILYKQKRLGFNNKEFSIYKFRSMYYQEVPEAVTVQAGKDDPRITKVGKFLRRSSIDELPQLMNVLEGSMSLVGPRPHAIDHNVEYGQDIRGYFTRHKVKPGITGWAQVNGWRGETDTLEKMEERVRHDIYYANNWSLLFDLQILIKTVLVAPFQKSAY